MQHLRFICWIGLLLGGTIAARGQPQTNTPTSPSLQLLREQKHLAECLAYGYSPPLWISYEGALYFAPKEDAQVKAVEHMKAQRARYVALTNPAARHEFAAKVIAGSGLDPSWQHKLLLSLGPTNQDLLPRFDRPITILRTYEVLQALGSGDALLRESGNIYFVMNFGDRPADAAHTNACLVWEGTKTYRTISGASKTVEAFSNLALTGEEIATLNKVVAAFQKEAATLGEQISDRKARADFEEHRAKANDSAPAYQFLLARDYLEGKGTDQDRKLGLELMYKAAANGSGDAKAYLDTGEPPSSSGTK